MFVIWLHGAQTGARKTTDGSWRWITSMALLRPSTFKRSNPVRRSIGCPTLRPFMAATCDNRADPENNSRKSIFPWVTGSQLWLPYVIPSGPDKSESAWTILLAGSVSFVVVQPSTAVVSAWYIDAVLSALCKATGSKGISTSSTGWWSFLIWWIYLYHSST